MRRHSRIKTVVATPINQRAVWFLVCVYITFGAIVARLFFWQIIKHQELEAVAQAQYQRTVLQTGKRGDVFFANGDPLITNIESYRLFAQPHLIADENKLALAEKLAKILIKLEPEESTDSLNNLEAELLKKLTKPKVKWISLYQPVDTETKAAIEAIGEKNLGFDSYYQRFYPEASMAAHLTGFVGKNSQGDDVGYFGLEGNLQHELQPRSVTDHIVADATGVSIEQDQLNAHYLDGRNVTTSIERNIQYTIEKQLKAGLEKYGAEAGEIIVTQPQTGKILALAATPNFDPNDFYQYDSQSYINPALSSLYEPGSTFKILTVATGIDAGVLTPDTVCTKCAGPRQFGQFTLKTWNEEYHPNITMTEALAKSDNVAMIFAAELIGSTTFRDYLQKFGIGKSIGLDLQGDVNTPFPDSWVPVELATASFGQGIVTTSLQLVQAVGAIANRGQLMQLQILNSVYDPTTQTEIKVEPKTLTQVVKPETARQVTEMMVNAAVHGEAQWTYHPDHSVAGKTGTSQVANESGYDSSKTIASFIGFAPADDPQFLMFVKLVAPQTSPWAAETAAPLWYATADDLYLLLNIPPDKSPEVPKND